MKRIYDKNFLIVYLICLAAALIAPQVIHSTFAMNIIILSLIWSIMGVGWNFIGGYAGQVSNGHALYYAIGAYAVAVGTAYYKITPWIMLFVGMAISVVIAYFIGKPLLRLNGAYFLIATMAVAECARIIFLNTKYLGAATGISFLAKKVPQWYTLQFTDKKVYCYVLVAVLALLMLFAKYVDRSKFGYYLRAIKANETSAQASGINTPQQKVRAYMLSAAIVSLAGSLYAPFVLYVDPYTLLPLDKSTMICLVVVMGGVGTVWGPVLGAFVMTFISEYARAIFAGKSGTNMLVYGILVIIIILFMPGGLISLVDGLKKKISSFKKRKAANAATDEEGKEEC